MNRDRPRFVRNDPQVEILNSLYGVTFTYISPLANSTVRCPRPGEHFPAHCALAYDERASRSIRTLLRRKESAVSLRVDLERAVERLRPRPCSIVTPRPDLNSPPFQ